MNGYLIMVVPAISLVALVAAMIKFFWIKSRDEGTDEMKTISANIREGAMAFLKKEYSILSVFVVIVALVLGIINHDSVESHSIVALSFVVGACLSALAGYVGMKTATFSNVRATNAARTSLNGALKVAFNGGAVMGLSVVGFGLLGLSLLFIVYLFVFNGGLDIVISNPSQEMMVRKILNVLAGFSLGASSIALFARVGGGIFTKAADVGADLVGKVEAGIPEDDPRNPAVIADNVGDNVGDVAGMGADLFESYIGALISSMILGVVWAVEDPGNSNAILIPLYISAFGIFASVVGTFFVRVKEGGNPQKALNVGTVSAQIIMIAGAWFIIKNLMPAVTKINGAEYTSTGLFIVVLLGIIVGTAIGFITEYFTGSGNRPV
ncbi:MAG TPA: sodium-translocating pyrophosphatase, partial [bacterium]|nr:sodium-translocating pyrophosphatase [bacterium]